MADRMHPGREVERTVDGLRVGVAQLRPRVGRIEANVRIAERYLKRAAKHRADLVVFPECFLQGYSLRPEELALAEPADGAAVSALAFLVETYRVAVVAGFVEQNPENPSKPFNAAAVIDCEGRRVGIYRKTHLFQDEDKAFTAGSSYPVFEVRVRAGRAAAHLGVAICMDLEYPEVIRLLAIGGAEIIAVPSANMEPYRPQQAAHMKSRAIENNLYVAVANAVDRREDLTLFGGSGVAGPAGSFAFAGYGRPGLVVAELSEREVQASGGAGSYLRGRRPDTYGDLLRQPT